MAGYASVTATQRDDRRGDEVMRKAADTLHFPTPCKEEGEGARQRDDDPAVRPPQRDIQAQGRRRATLPYPNAVATTSVVKRP